MYIRLCTSYSDMAQLYKVIQLYTCYTCMIYMYATTYLT